MIKKSREWFRMLPQNTDDWLIARCGRVSASRASDLLAQRPSAFTYLGFNTKSEGYELGKNEVWDKIILHIQKHGLVKKSGLDKILGLPSVSPINTLIKKNILITEDIPPKGIMALSGTARKYMISMITELASGKPKEQSSQIIKAIEWGNEYEEKARFEMMDRLDRDISVPGIILEAGDQRKSASVDGEVNEKEIVELKCPFSSETQIENFLGSGMKDEYWSQCQFQLMVSGADICHFGSYDPRYTCSHAEFRLFYKKVCRDEDYIDLLREASDRFVKILDEICQENKINRFLVECED
jgi:hypothetical protein